MTAPPFDCARCGCRIAEASAHFLLANGRVVCARCVANEPDDSALAHGPRAVIAARQAAIRQAEEIVAGVRKRHRSAS
jgi:recombinational DNA repair protein (RecF pathway)